MAGVMVRLKELRDLGFTVLLLHHTPKGNDRTYKGSTAILDLADHVLSLYKARKGNPDVEIENDEDRNFYYRLGTAQKTRYEPSHVFLDFTAERGFIEAEDPIEEDLRAIARLLSGKSGLNQGQLFDLVKEDMGLRSKGHFVSLLKKGEGRYWQSHRVDKAVYYEAISPVQLSGPIYKDSRTDAE